MTKSFSSPDDVVEWTNTVAKPHLKAMLGKNAKSFEMHWKWCEVNKTFEYHIDVFWDHKNDDIENDDINRSQHDLFTMKKNDKPFWEGMESLIKQLSHCVRENSKGKTHAFANHALKFFFGGHDVDPTFSGGIFSGVFLSTINLADVNGVAEIFKYQNNTRNLKTFGPHTMTHPTNTLDRNIVDVAPRFGRAFVGHSDCTFVLNIVWLDGERRRPAQPLCRNADGLVVGKPQRSAHNDAVVKSTKTKFDALVMTLCRKLDPVVKAMHEKHAPRLNVVNLSLFVKSDRSCLARMIWADACQTTFCVDTNTCLDTNIGLSLERLAWKMTQ